MTTSKIFELTCNGCFETKEWGLEATRRHGEKSLIRNAGYSRETHDNFFKGTDHYCPDCNDRTKTTFHVTDGRGDDVYLGTIQAWGIVHARRAARDKFNREFVMVTETRAEADQLYPPHTYTSLKGAT